MTQNTTDKLQLLRVRPGFGNHFVGDKMYRAGDTFEDPTGRMHLAFPDKLEQVRREESKAAREAMHPCGEDLTSDFQAACDALSAICSREVKVYRKGRRYRILIDNDIQDTEPSNIVNARQLQKAFSALSKEMQQAYNDEPEDEETPEDNGEAESPAEDEDDDIDIDDE